MISIKNSLEANWYDKLQDTLEQPFFSELLKFVQTERDRHIIYPVQNEIFNALNLCSFEQTKVVILGQDPYHGPHQAHGLSFSVPAGIKIPPSLNNIFKELGTDVNIAKPKQGDLSIWAQQGVLLLNSVLTVRDKSPGSHQKMGWETFTDAIIELLSHKKKNVVFILWGNYAKAKTYLINDKQHLVLTSTHPSPFSAHRGFLGSQPFSKTNAYLKLHQKSPISWEL